MQLYETTFILHPERTEEELEALLERIKNIITQRGGEVVEEDRWGVKRLAYEIKDLWTGFYTVLRFNGDSAIKEELERNFRIMEDLLRYIIVRAEE